MNTIRNIKKQIIKYIKIQNGMNIANRKFCFISVILYMITLKQPITVTVPPITKSNGTVKEFAPIVLNNIDYIVNYDNARKVAYAIIKGVNRPVILWQGQAYDSVGQFTDVDVDARMSEILGSDPAKAISDLFLPATSR